MSQITVGDFVRVRRVVLDEQTTLGTRMLLLLSLGRLGCVVDVAASKRNPVMVEFTDGKEPRALTFMVYELCKVLPVQTGVSNARQEGFPL